MVSSNALQGKTYLVTGGGHRVGAMIALAIAHAGGNVVIHYHASKTKAEQTKERIEKAGANAWLVRADLEDENAARKLIEEAFRLAPLDGLVNNAAYFEPGTWEATTPKQWHQHLKLNLTAPFVLSQAFSRRLGNDHDGVILNIVDLCSRKPRTSHVAYSVSKAALESLTRVSALALAPRIRVNALALGAVLPPSDGGNIEAIVNALPVARTATEKEVQNAAIFLLAHTSYITGEILHLDGGKHLI